MLWSLATEAVVPAGMRCTHVILIGTLHYCPGSRLTTLALSPLPQPRPVGHAGTQTDFPDEDVVYPQMTDQAVGTEAVAPKPPPMQLTPQASEDMVGAGAYGAEPSSSE